MLDVGSGIGGAARAFAAHGAYVTAVDLTEEFVELARELNHASGLGESITSLCAAGEDTGLEPGSFDVATLLHVGMNLEDKASVFAEVHRLLAPGGVFGVYDLMGSNDLHYPQPGPTRLRVRSSTRSAGTGSCWRNPGSRSNASRT